MKLCVIIDPIESLNPKKDSSIAMLVAAQKKNIELYYATQDDLYVDNGNATGKLTPISVASTRLPWYQTGSEKTFLLGELDIILMRKDPPFDMNYIYTTYLLELAAQQGCLVANSPQGLRDASEKYYTSFFPKLCPPTLINQSLNRFVEFWEQHHDIIMKPLDGMGGRGIFHIGPDGKNLSVAWEVLSNNGKLAIMAQKYIPEIKTHGDKRVLIIGETVIPYALARIPQGMDERGNLAKGAIGDVIKLSDSEMEMAQALIPSLVAKGLYFSGIDIIGPYITEINVTSPTCIQEIAQATEQDIAGMLIDYLLTLVNP